MRRIGAIVGLPGSGKSEFCRIARDDHGCAVLSFDDLVATALRPVPNGDARDAGPGATRRLGEAAFAQHLRRARRRFAADGVTVLDSFPKGRRQAEIVSDLVEVSFLIVVHADEAGCRARAMQRSPARFTPASTERKFGERRRQTQEVEAFARRRGLAIHELDNAGDLADYQAQAARILTTLCRDKDHHDDSQPTDPDRRRGTGQLRKLAVPARPWRGVG